jgi:hypothetical protein
MGIICIRDEKKTEGHYRDYNVSDLLEKVDGVLADHGFVESGEITDKEARINYRVYEGVKGNREISS